MSKLNNLNFNSSTHWVTEEGTLIAIGQMVDSHLGNSINMLRRATKKLYPDKSDEQIDKILINSYKIFKPMLEEQTKRLKIELNNYKPNQLESRDW
jgi:hypothetical protein